MKNKEKKSTMEKEREFEKEIYKETNDSDLKKREIAKLVTKKNISKRLGRYLESFSDLVACMQMAEICTRYQKENGRNVALENAEFYLEKTIAVYLSTDKRYGWTPDKMTAYHENTLPEGHKELIDWAMKMKNCNTGERKKKLRINQNLLN